MNDSDIEVELIPEPENDIYLTGDEVQFSLRIANTSESNHRHGIIVLYWYIENVNTPTPVAFELEPNEETTIKDVFSIWLGQTGTGECHLTAPSNEDGQTMSPEEIEEIFRTQSQIEIPSQGRLNVVPGFIHEFQDAVGHVICQFRIRDRATVENERERAEQRRELLNTQRDLAEEQTQLTQEQTKIARESKRLNNRIFWLTVVLAFLTIVMAVPAVIELINFF